ncbi:MAG: Asp-tRNA(Asn)/Glu-tRNA(Gln) amidotransferase subunit GatC, partial [Rhodospirillales bacterium]
MSLDKATVARIAALARIRVDEEELDGLAEELSQILGWIEQLNEVDTEGVPPMSKATDQKMRRREDVVDDGGIVDK